MRGHTGRCGFHRRTSFTTRLCNRTKGMGFPRKITTAMLFALACVCLAVLGCLSEILIAAAPADLAIHDTYFIVARLHYVLYTSGLMGFFAATYYLFPKGFGRSLNELLGKIHFAVTFVASNWTFFPIFIFNTVLQPRRYAYPTDYGWLSWFQGTQRVGPLRGPNEFRTIGAFVLAAVQLMFLANCFYSLFWGRRPDPH
jgi:cytochrome c oxidase subunit 1